MNFSERQNRFRKTVGDGRFSLLIEGPVPGPQLPPQEAVKNLKNLEAAVLGITGIDCGLAILDRNSNQEAWSAIEFAAHLDPESRDRHVVYLSGRNKSMKEIDRQLAIEAFRRAWSARRPDQQLIIHTDRGCQYTSWDFRREVASHGALQSMSRPGTPHDNACAETFFKTLKVECIDREHFKSRSEAHLAVAKYILFYNRVRIHQSLGYSSPADFELALIA